jgi:C1A family cysteine protease
MEKFSGYLIEEEDHDWLSQREDPEIMLRAARAAYPSFNPYVEPYVPVENQKSMSSCVGQSLAVMFQIAMVQQYGLQAKFSRMCSYIMSQKASQISGDRGATLSGAQKAAEQGICLERYWPYPSRYSSSIPSTAQGEMVFKLKGSRQIRDADLVEDLLMSGCPCHVGLSWNSTCENSVCNSYRSGGGGHAVSLCHVSEKTGHFVLQNSWGTSFGDMGRVLWTKNFISEVMKKDRYSTFFAYDAAGFEAPQEKLQEI